MFFIEILPIIAMRHSIILLFFPIILFFCTKNEMPETPLPPDKASNEMVDLLALGDSYTKGQGVPWDDNFPNQLYRRLSARGYAVQGPHVVAQTGWRTTELLGALQQQTAIADSVFSLVTLCIGVNNQYTSGSLDEYRQHFEILLQKAITFSGNRPKRVVVLSIPDYAYTPFGQNNPDISAELDAFNAINQTLANQYGVSYVFVTDISRQSAQMPDLIAPDGLHPSVKQYSAWMERLVPACELALQP
jgi:lysophospholipase L1-like esterase